MTITTTTREHCWAAAQFCDDFSSANPNEPSRCLPWADTGARYLKLCRWAAARYRREDGSIVTFVGGVPSIYTRIEQSAWRKYMR